MQLSQPLGRTLAKYYPETISLLMTMFIFSGYVVGYLAPPWDFWGAYTTSAHTWWELGGVFNPPDFLPFIGATPPSYLIPQASQFYLPVGLFHLLYGGFTPHAASALQAVTVSVGVIGAAVVFRKFGFPNWISMLAALAYFFSAGFFGNAQHADIVRAWAFFPWVIIFLVSKKRTGVFSSIAWAVFWWQFFVGVYPGNIVSTAYVSAFLSVSLIVIALRSSSISEIGLLWSQKLALVIAGMLAALLKWLPFFAGADYQGQPNQLQFDYTSLVTIIFPFLDQTLSNDVTMRTFFLLPTTLFAIPFAFLSNKKAPSFIRFIGVGMVMMFLVLGPTWSNFDPQLPMLEASRFRVADFKPVLQFGLIFLAAEGLRNLTSGKIKSQSYYAVLFFNGLIVCVLTGIAFSIGLPGEQIAVGLVWSISSIFLLILLKRSNLHEISSSPRGIKLMTVTAVSAVIGLSWAVSASLVWITDREQTERALWGFSSGELIAQSQDSTLGRQERFVPIEGYTSAAEVLSVTQNGSEYLKRYSAGGYTSLKSAGVVGQAYLESASSEGWLFNEVASAPKAYFRSRDSNLFNLECLEPKCLEIAIDRWALGEIKVTIPPIESGYLLVNELNFKGWQARICKDGQCVYQASLGSDESLMLGLVIESSSKPQDVYFIFEAPGKEFSLVLLAMSILVVTLAALMSALGRRERIDL